MKKTFILAILILTATSFIGSVNAQTYGKLFTKVEADKLFGAVVESISVTVAEVKNILTKSTNTVMFRISGGTLSILVDDRKAVYPSSDIAVGKDDVYYLYSKSVVEDLLKKGTGDSFKFEVRKEVHSVTYGEYTIELAQPCPPQCG